MSALQAGGAPGSTYVATDGAAYDAQAIKLRDMFRKNFQEKGFAELGIEPVM